MKLKTLKDFKEHDGKHPVLKEVVFTKENLRWEAIKWVKDINKKMEKCSDKIDSFFLKGCRDILIEFHNITEDELK